MKHQSVEEIEKRVEKKIMRREKKKKPAMHISGKSVFSLQKLMKEDKRSKRKKGRKKNPRKAG